MRAQVSIMNWSKWHRSFTLLVLCWGVAGCTSLGDKLNPFNWFASKPGIKPAELVEVKAPSITFTTMWRTNTSAAGAFAFAPAVADGTVYAAGSGGDLTAIDAQNGAQRWRGFSSRRRCLYRYRKSLAPTVAHCVSLPAPRGGRCAYGLAKPFPWPLLE